MIQQPAFNMAEREGGAADIAVPCQFGNGNAIEQGITGRWRLPGRLAFRTGAGGQEQHSQQNEGDTKL